eukprot:PhF_6_TR5255/c0_g1_i1/m.7632
MRISKFLRRGYKLPYIEYPQERATAKQFGAEPRVRRLHDVFYHDLVPQDPLRAKMIHEPLPPILYDRKMHLADLNAAMAPARVPNQIRDTIAQLEVGIRNADEYYKKHLLPAIHRPTSLQLWTAIMESRKGHVVAALPTHHAIPLVSLLLADYVEGHMTVRDVEETYSIMFNLLTAHSPAVKRELANNMIRIYVLAGEPDKALAMLRTMKIKKIRRSYITYAPLYRLARSTDDVDLHLAVEKLCLEMEGGTLGKLIRIDIPRMFGAPFIAARYSWSFVSGVLLIAYSLGFICLMCWLEWM